MQSTEVNVFAWARSWLVRYLWNFCQDSLIVEAVKCISPALDNRPKMRVQLLSSTHPKDGFKNSKNYRSDENHKVTHSSNLSIQSSNYPILHSPHQTLPIKPSIVEYENRHNQ